MDPKQMGKKGGKARAKNLTPEQQSEIGRKGAEARWAKEGKDPPAIAMYGAPDRPLRIGGIEIPCYVLADGRRVLAQRGLQAGIGLSTSGGSGGAQRMARFVASLEAKEVDTMGLAVRMGEPIRFTPPKGGNAYGYEATILPDLCRVIMDAGRLGKLTTNQLHIVERCTILQHGFATVGIIALVDEATGYQAIRARNALAQILEKFISKELRRWIKTFPPEFYEEMYRLWGWEYDHQKPNAPKPLMVGKLTDSLVYKRLAPGVRDELRRVVPRDDKGRLKHKLHQRLTEDAGHPKLREHLSAVIALMKASDNKEGFQRAMDRALPPFGKNLELRLDD